MRRIRPLIFCSSGLSTSPGCLVCRRECLDLVLELVGLLAAELPNAAVELADEVGVAQGGLVEDGDVAAGLVGDVDLVPLLAQADERAAHADHVVVRVGLKTTTRLGKIVVAGARCGVESPGGSGDGRRACRRASR